MNLYLPIAEMPVSIPLFLTVGALVGALSGLFGVGGGFLLTPLLIFLGIPPGVAVGTGAAQIVASSVAGAATQFQRRNVDVRLGTVMIIGGIAGALIGVEAVRLLRRYGVFDVTLALSYVTLLGIIGTLMLIEGFNAWRGAMSGAPAKARSSGGHNWMERLPLKMRFHRSKLYVSALPPAIIGMFVGFLAALMGVGGGFVTIPAMIYLLRVPTSVAVGTSLFQIVFVAAFTTLLHAVLNKTVDVLLALILILGGAIGAQLGSIFGERLRGDQVRLFLALIVLVVAVRMAYDLVVMPQELFNFGPILGRRG
jgi:uncharacterized protein